MLNTHVVPPKNQPLLARNNRHAPSTCPLRKYAEADLFEILEKKEKQGGAAPLLLVLEGIQDPHNLGACLRSADAAGADAVILPRKGTVSLSETVRRIACGGADRIPLINVGNLAHTLQQLGKRGYQITGLSDQGSTLLYDLDLTPPLALVLGNEAQGLRRIICQCCDTLCHLPMAGSVHCLNLSVAAGISLFEAVRQRLA